VLALQILTITPPGHPDPTPGMTPRAVTLPTGAPAASLPEAPPLSGTVAGATPQGQPLLATRQGMIVLNVQASLPQGARITAMPVDPNSLPATAPLPSELGPVGERDWPAMRQLLTVLAGLEAGAARSLLAALPQPNRKLTAALTFFLSALRGGDAHGWLGDETRAALEKSGRGRLLAQLEQDFRALQRDAGEPLPGDWRPYTLPMLDGTRLHPIQLHLHPLKEEEAGQDGRAASKGSRFLIDVELSRLGPLQLDGLVRPNHLDLILRSHTVLQPELRQELMQIFSDSLRTLGYSGGLSFQSGARCWVKLTRAGGAGVAVTA
jgi:hypothetical protein